MGAIGTSFIAQDRRDRLSPEHGAVSSAYLITCTNLKTLPPIHHPHPALPDSPAPSVLSACTGSIHVGVNMIDMSRFIVLKPAVEPVPRSTLWEPPWTSTLSLEDPSSQAPRLCSAPSYFGKLEWRA
jgi:hypothetical protein